jgi:hypothetical protein
MISDKEVRAISLHVIFVITYRTKRKLFILQHFKSAKKRVHNIYADIRIVGLERLYPDFGLYVPKKIEVRVKIEGNVIG